MADEPLLTQAQVAKAIGVSPRTLRGLEQRTSGDHRVGKGNKLRYTLGAVCELVELRIADAVRLAAGDEAMLADADSPSLERWRAAKAAQEEIKLAEMRGEYASLDRVREQLDAGAAILRRCGEQIERRYGDGPATLFREHLDEWASGLEIDLNGGVDEQ